MTPGEIAKPYARYAGVKTTVVANPKEYRAATCRLPVSFVIALISCPDFYCARYSHSACRKARISLNFHLDA